MKEDEEPKVVSDKSSSSLQSGKTSAQAVTRSPAVSGVSNKLLLGVGVVVLVALFGGLAYYLGAKEAKLPWVTGTNGTQTVGQTSSPVSSAAVPQAPLFSGQLEELSRNLGIFKLTEDDKLNGVENDFVYYGAGKFSRGELVGYTRVIAIRPSLGPGQPLVFTLATKDFQRYILDDPDNKTTEFPESDWQNPYSVLDKTKIVSTGTFDTEQPSEIDLNQDLALYQEEFPIDSVQTDKTDKNGNKIYKTLLVTDFSAYQKLSSPFDNLSVYFRPYEGGATYANQLSQGEKEKADLKQKYLAGEAEVVVVDSVGLPILYSLTTPGNIRTYKEKLAQFEVALKNYEDQLKKFEDKQISQYPKAPDYVYPPNLGFSRSQISSQANLSFYNDYGPAVPGACALTLNSWVVKVADVDLEQVGTVSGLPFYRLKDKSSGFYTLAYKNKLDYYDQEPAAWDQVNKGIKKPTLDEYVSANPLLFIKDYWGRWVALGEFDIKLPGGCGKPVIYLYPASPTRVSVQFQVPVQMVTDIPTYAGSWQVMAYPDGSLVNLAPGFTDCRQIDSQKKGSEYAKQACQSNTYPYLYWAGSINSEEYPVADGGWIVERDRLGDFLENKLTEIGLNGNERSDFVSYWLPEMLLKGSPYYRISFLQTSDLNSLFPMSVSPKPETTFRIFLDYLPLSQKPPVSPRPQELNKLVRNGFTLVEWGGLKQP